MPVNAQSSESHPPPPQAQYRSSSQARSVVRTSPVNTHPPPQPDLHSVVFPSAGSIANSQNNNNNGNELWDLRDSWVQPSSGPNLQNHWPVCHPDLALLEGTDALPFFSHNLMPRNHVQLQLPRPLTVNTGRSMSTGAMQPNTMWHTPNDFTASTHSYLESRPSQQPGCSAPRPTAYSEPTPLWCVSSMPCIQMNSWEGLPPASVSQHLLMAHGTYCPPVIAALPWQADIAPRSAAQEYSEDGASLAQLLSQGPGHSIRPSHTTVGAGACLNLSATQTSPRSPRRTLATRQPSGPLRGGKLEPGSYGFNQVGVSATFRASISSVVRVEHFDLASSYYCWSRKGVGEGSVSPGVAVHGGRELEHCVQN